MKSAVIKRSVRLEGRKTSVSLEDAFWTALKEIAHSQGGTAASLIAAVEAARKPVNLSSAIRIFVLEHHRNKINRQPCHTPTTTQSEVMKANLLKLGADLRGEPD
jgi:predicted DNA-binding ribbon-helix-helix protein